MNKGDCPLCYEENRQLVDKNLPIITCPNCQYYQERSLEITREQLIENIDENRYYSYERPIIEAKVSDVKRQGRSKATRERIERQKELWKNLETISVSECARCKGDNMKEDVHRGSVFCEDCGFENAGNYLNGSLSEKQNGDDDDNCDDQQNMQQPVAYHDSNSKPYEREVHLSQKMSSAYGTDPRIPFKHIEKIQDYLLKHNNVSGRCLFLTGPQAIKQAVIDLKLPVVYAGRWVQIRKRLDEKDIHNDVATMPYDYMPILKLRFSLVSKAFNQTLGKSANGQKRARYDMVRKNILNLNYIIPCLMRIDNEEMFQENARFFHQQSSQNQPKKNNERWKVIIDYCIENFSKRYNLKNGKYIDLHWKYIPITTIDIIDYFKQLR